MKEITIQDIDHLLHVIDDSIRWASVHDEHAFPVSAFKEKRRNLKKIRFALEENCSAAAYGESQNGKSYLISSLLSNQGDALTISGGGWATLWLHRRYQSQWGKYIEKRIYRYNNSFYCTSRHITCCCRQSKGATAKYSRYSEVVG